MTLQNGKAQDEGEHDEHEEGQDEHLPEWVRIFGELQREAEEAYPDGRVRILVPRRRNRRLKTA